MFYFLMVIKIKDKTLYFIIYNFNLFIIKYLSIILENYKFFKTVIKIITNIILYYIYKLSAKYYLFMIVLQKL